ncbi:MAG: phosphoribosyl-ATP diphosphatase, partial [Cellulosilyticaceae bacterium]
LWLKGETSGHFQYVKSISVDCDGDTLLLQIEQEGGISCHTGHATCFYTTYQMETDEVQVEAVRTPKVDDGNGKEGMLEHLYQVAKDRKAHPKEGSYTNYLFDQGENKILKKVGEEAAEIIIAAKDHGGSGELVGEIADFLYHLNVLMVEKGVDWEQVDQELQKRM